MSDDKNDQPARDAKGRWRKGHCPNPKGRPRKRLKSYDDPGDLRDFSTTMIEIMAGGRPETMDRRAALLHKMFESAMKGKVSMQRFLFKEFERNTEQLAMIRILYDKLMAEWVFKNPNFRSIDDSNIPFNIQLEITSLETLLNHYHPGGYPNKHSLTRKDIKED